jgi:hypothetical protein
MAVHIKYAEKTGNAHNILVWIPVSKDTTSHTQTYRMGED